MHNNTSLSLTTEYCNLGSVLFWILQENWEILENQDSANPWILSELRSEYIKIWNLVHHYSHCRPLRQTRPLHYASESPLFYPVLHTRPDPNVPT